MCFTSLIFFLGAWYVSWRISRHVASIHTILQQEQQEQRYKKYKKKQKQQKSFTSIDLSNNHSRQHSNTAIDVPATHSYQQAS